MPATKKVLRGVQNIRTMSGRVDDQAIPYKAYMKSSVLEMEKHRRGVERALRDALKRFRSGVYALWYPQVQRRESRQFPGQLKELQEGRAFS